MVACIFLFTADELGQWEAPHVWQTPVIITVSALPLKASRSFYILQVIVWLSSDFKPSMTTADGNPIQRNPIKVVGKKKSRGHLNSVRLPVDGRVSFSHLNQSIAWLLKLLDAAKLRLHIHLKPSQRGGLKLHRQPNSDSLLRLSLPTFKSVYMHI